MRSTSIRNASFVLLILLGILFGAAAAVFGLSTVRPLPLPAWITGQSGSSEASRVAVNLDRDLRDVRVEVGGNSAVAITLDGRSIDGLAFGGGLIVADVGTLRAGSHALEVSTPTPDSGPVCVMLHGVAADGSIVRIVSDDRWQCLRDGEWSSARITARYGEGPFGEPFGALPESQRVPKGPRFWVVLLSIAAALILATLGGPILDVGSPEAGRSLSAIRMGWLFASVAYASIACLIAAMGATTVETGTILAMQIGAAGLFVLALFGWRSGLSRGVEDDRRLGEVVRSYDSSAKLGRELALLAAQRQDLESSVSSEIRGLAESVRYLSVSEAAAPEDDVVHRALLALAEALRAGSTGEELSSLIAQLGSAVSAHRTSHP